MESINFPKMFYTTSTRIVNGIEATQLNLQSLLLSEKGELLGDPYFGTRLKQYIFDQNNYVLRDILIDELYTAIATFMPQLIINRSDIKITQDRTALYATVKVTNRLDYSTDMFNLVLFQEAEQ